MLFTNAKKYYIIFFDLKIAILKFEGEYAYMGSAFKNLFKKESSTEDEIKQLVEEDEQVGQLEKNQREMINNIFEFDDLDAGDIMTHRIDINALDCNLSIEKAVELAIEYGNSRLPVYDEDLDRICGVLYVKDLLKFEMAKSFCHIQENRFLCRSLCLAASFLPK